MQFTPNKITSSDGTSIAWKTIGAGLQGGASPASVEAETEWLLKTLPDAESIALEGLGHNGSDADAPIAVAEVIKNWFLRPKTKSTRL